ncbi:MAG TPA: SPOR domain-containing protein [Lysobacter sp.]|nr:SPOR domain-containing protein [Lysobacter sp.]
MDPALKQRLIGAVVLVALAVIFLPMLIKGPAPESGVANVPLQPPQAPADGEFETRELPLVEPAAAPQGGALGMPAEREPEALPAVDAGSAPEVAAGDWAVSFGSYASADDAARVVAALRQTQLPGYAEPYTSASGRALHRVRIGPFATQADAEAARVRAAALRSDVRIEVIALDANADAARASADAAATVKAPSDPPAAKPTERAAAAAATKPEPERKPEPKPAPAQPPKPATTAPAAADVGFAVQVGAFGDAAEAARMRERLRAAGFTAFTETVRTERGTLNRVRVGPVSTRAEADRLKADVAAKAGVDGIVRPHP